MSENLVLWDFAAYLDVVRAWYPSGIPERLIQDVEVCEEDARQIFATGSPFASLLFIALRTRGEHGFTGKEGELLAAAITKGMRLPLQDVYLLDLPEVCRAETGSVRSLLRLLQTASPKFIVALGSEVIGCLGIKGALCPGAWFEWRGVPLILSRRLDAVLGNAQVKKEFWSDLQQVLLKMRGTGK